MDTIDRSLAALHPVFRRHLSSLLGALHASGVKLYIFEGLRSYNRQGWLYAQGRARSGKIVTHAKPGYSMHNYGLAADLVFNTGPTDHKWSWDGDYAPLGELIAAYPRLEWMGHSKTFPEMPHVQLKTNYTIDHIRQKYLKLGMEGVWQLFKD